MPGYVVLIVLMGALLHASWNAVVKSSGDKFLNVVMVIAVAGLAAALALPFFPQPASASWPYLLVSSVLQVVYIVLVSKAYRHGDMSLAYPLMRGTAPLLVALASGPLIGEALPALRWLGILLVSAGVLAMALGVAPARRRGRAHCGGCAAQRLLHRRLHNHRRHRRAPFRRAHRLYALDFRRPCAASAHLGACDPARRSSARICAGALARLLFGAFATLASYGSALWAMSLHVPIASVSALRETSIIFAAGLSVLLFKERLGKWRWAGIGADLRRRRSHPDCMSGFDVFITFLGMSAPTHEAAGRVRLPNMNQALKHTIGHSTCPHDCPSVCALDVELLDSRTIGRVHGAKDQTYTAGVICAKVARYAERIHHPDRLLKPLIRAGGKGEGVWKEASFDAALDLIAEKFLAAEREFGSQSVWPYYYAGTMGLVQRDGINRLRHAKRYSSMFDPICTNPAWTGWFAGTGKLAGVDPREMGKSDCVVIWGTNAVATQINVMTHAIKARKERGAKIVVIDIYRNDTVAQADMGLILKPGTDGALAAAVMHILFRDGLADRAYLEKHTDDPKGLEAHLQSKTPEWAAAITGLSVEEITAFAHLVGKTQAHLFPPRLRLLAPAQRRGEHACGFVHPGGLRPLAI